MMRRPVKSFDSVQHYIDSLPRRDTRNLRGDIKEMDESGTLRNPFTKIMRQAALRQLRIRGATRAPGAGRMTIKG